jgi:polysaccharide export outer membrane protein
MEARNPQDNVIVEANDVITIPKAQLFYVVGEVQRPGGYAVNEKDSISLLQAVALAGGLNEPSGTNQTAADVDNGMLHETPVPH